MKLLSYGLQLFRTVVPRLPITQCIFQNYPKTNFLWYNAKHNFNFVRQIHSSQQNSSRVPRTPDLIYVPHIFRWLKSKFRFKYLQKTWDPEFSEGAFIYGTTRALCRITEIIHSDTSEDLEGLLTHTAKMRLENDMVKKITKTQKQIIKLHPEDIKILVPIAVKLKTEGSYKTCAVSMRSLALKWFEDGGGLKLVLVALQTEFIRDYSYGTDSDWTISVFDVLECAVLSESSSR